MTNADSDPKGPAPKRRSDRANANFREIRLPFALRAVRLGLRTCDRLSSSLAAKLALRMFLTPTHRQPKGKEREILERAEQAEVAVGALLVHTYRWGDAGQPTVLLSHGWDSHAGSLTAFVDPLVERGWSVLAFDGPAHGRSPGKQATLGQFALVVATLVAKRPTIVAVLGHSFGGAAAVIGLVQAPSAVTRLVLISPPRRPDTALAQFAAAFWLSPQAAQGLRKGLAAHHDRDLEYYCTDELARGLAVQGLVIHDEDDITVALADAKAIADAMTHAELMITQGLGHLRILRDPAVIARAVAALGEPGAAAESA
jgi:pimeloyl-ACP methyl ester carboxylesterase